MEVDKKSLELDAIAIRVFGIRGCQYNIDSSIGI